MLRVVKLGGNLHEAPELADWLQVLARAGGRIVVVPGGGPFADAVRAAQARWGFTDAAAHHMALLAMEQYGLMLCALEPGLIPASDPEDIARVLVRGRTPVWLPSSLCVGAADIPESWSVTSDSLAAWLAARLGAEALALVKHTVPVDIDPRALALAGWVDTAFPHFAKAFGKPIHLLGRQEAPVFGEWLAHPV
ncbi:hypothetical protein TPL01_10470 [Sulfuriferula plumbiphila]|uniref:Aspartate/glutamate/uridylate kinase domain-containing protein n=1 Tax=Sulfuriferula plumbiphila TaxID=171865 RepID=A0A512L5Z8_9PROT|nr:amino acid kinase [Sulfuriferula plumbiphila]BBP05166.1 hypothetical protein SFPGR_25880 [Sulfuriferula plumbiphila]GEP29909.1 hypothetical protein TPL01_10470 [Sulfuriferula plumbiphila]